MMMLAVMYGMIPSAKIEKLSNAPPENRFRNPSAPCWLAVSFSCEMAIESTPGTRMNTPNRYTATMATTNKILFRRSSTLKMFARLLITRMAPLSIASCRC